MKPFRFSTPASAEFAEAVRWYETRRTLRAGRLPHRRVLVAGFPYQIVYRVRDNDLYVIAVAHTSRRPDFWQGRQ